MATSITRRTSDHRKVWTRQPEPGDLVSGLPTWAFILIGIAAPAVLLLSAPIKMLTLGLLWGAYLYFFFTEPERTIPMFLCTLILIKLSHIGGTPLLRGLHSSTIFFVTLAIATYWSRARQGPSPPKNPLILPTVFIFLVFTFSAILAYGTGSAQQHSFANGWYPLSAFHIFSKLKNHALFLFIGPMAFRMLWNVQQIRHVAYCISIYSASVAFDALTHRGQLLTTADTSRRFIRATGQLFFEANILGGFLAMAVVLLVPLALARKNSLQARIALGSGAGLAMVALVFSFSRGAWIATLAGLLVLAVLRGAKGLIVVTVMALTFTFWVPQAVIDRIDHSFQESEAVGLDQEVNLDHSAAGRIDRWKAVPGLWADAPIIGHGFLGYGRAKGRINGFGAATAAHSAIAQITVEEGVLGLFAYFFVLAVPAFLALRLRKRTDDPFLDAAAVAVICGACCLVVLDVTGPRFFQELSVMPFWILAGGVARMNANLDTAATKNATATPVVIPGGKTLRSPAPSGRPAFRRVR